MIRFRPFLNWDPPAIAQIWCSQSPSHGLMQPMTPALLDHLVLSKPYFDRNGLIIAEEEGRPVGFGHAGFGPEADGSGLRQDVGITCLMMVAPHPTRQEIASELLHHTEQYLAEKGARTFHGGGCFPREPFYLGLYGGSASPGILASDTLQLTAYQNAGYKAVDRTHILQRELAGFRPAVDRRIIQLKREMELSARSDSLPATWWDACTLGQIDRLQFLLTSRDGADPLGSASFWDVEPMASSWGVHAMGLLDIQIRDDIGQEYEERQLTTYLLGESMRQLQSFGVTLIEVQVSGENSLLGDVCERLGYREASQGIRFRKARPG